MKTITTILFILSVTLAAHADEFPISIGAGSDTVFLKTGVSPDWEKKNAFCPELSATLLFDQNMRVREIVVIGDKSPDHPTSLNGVSLEDKKEDIIAKLGKPNARFPKEPDELMDVYRLVWLLKNRILIVSFWETDDKDAKVKKDTVAFMSLRSANL